MKHSERDEKIIALVAIAKIAIRELCDCGLQCGIDHKKHKLTCTYRVAVEKEMK